MNLEAYIESGIIESYLLGLASPEDAALLERLRGIYPELETEISSVEYKLQRVALEGGTEPPAQVWTRIEQRLQWWKDNGDRYTQEAPSPKADFTYILQPRGNTITVSIWWRCGVIVLLMLIMALLASTIYFYRQYHELEKRLMRLYPGTEAAQPARK